MVVTWTERAKALLFSVRRKSKADHWRSLHLHSLGTKGSLRSLSKQHTEATFILAHLGTNLLFKSVILLKKNPRGWRDDSVGKGPSVPSLTLIPRTRMVEGERGFLQVVL